MRVRVLYGVIGVLTLAVIAVAVAWALDDGAPEPTNEAEAAEAIEHYLFVQTAQRGTLTPIDGREGMYRLELDDLHPQALFFSDRPFRDTGAISIDGLISEVFDSAESPPNAALDSRRLRAPRRRPSRWSSRIQRMTPPPGRCHIPSAR